MGKIGVKVINEGGRNSLPQFTVSLNNALETMDSSNLIDIRYSTTYGGGSTTHSAIIIYIKNK